MASIDRVEVVRYGQTTDLLTLPYQLTKLQGYGAARVTRRSERAPNQHGDTDTGFVLEPRVLSGVIVLAGSAFEADEDAAYSLFTPGPDLMQLRFTKPSGVVRQLDCRVVEGPEGDTDSWYANGQKFGFALKASDPTFYDPDQKSQAFTLGVATNIGQIPSSVPTIVGTATLNASYSIEYDGDWAAYPVITVKGPMTGLKIRHDTTGDVIQFRSTVTIPAGSTYTIDCRPGYKVVRDQSGALKTAELTDESDLATFHLAPPSEVDGGVNTFTVTGSDASSSSNVLLVWHNRYLKL